MMMMFQSENLKLFTRLGLERASEYLYKVISVQNLKIF